MRGLKRVHEESETMFTVGEWRLMRGQLPWLANQVRYFMHHDCSQLSDSTGEPYWKTWYCWENEDERWCECCESEPPAAIRGMYMMMELI